MKLAESLTEKQLRKIRRVIGEAFVSNELFHEFGNIKERRQLVLKYMAAYVDQVYETRSLYMTADGLGFIGLKFSEDNFALSQMKMLWRIFLRLPFRKLKRMLGHISQIADENRRYANSPHIDILMVAVDKHAQGKGYSTKLISFAQDMAKEKGVPLLADTDMKSYAEMYQHLGFELYNKKTASNGVTRYNLVWKP
jgi:GNAT superfamily N-acetyltransferase